MIKSRSVVCVALRSFVLVLAFSCPHQDLSENGIPSIPMEWSLSTIKACHVQSFSGLCRYAPVSDSRLFRLRCSRLTSAKLARLNGFVRRVAAPTRRNCCCLGRARRLSKIDRSDEGLGIQPAIRRGCVANWSRSAKTPGIEKTGPVDRKQQGPLVPLAGFSKPNIWVEMVQAVFIPPCEFPGPRNLTAPQIWPSNSGRKTELSMDEQPASPKKHETWQQLAGPGWSRLQRPRKSANCGDWTHGFRVLGDQESW